MITNYILEKKLNNLHKNSISTQTIGLDDPEFYANISKNKNIRLFYSKVHKDYVLSINFGRCKSYIITRSMWKIFRNYFDKIDFVLNNKK